MSNSLDLLAFAFCLLIDGIKIMRECKILFLEINDCERSTMLIKIVEQTCVREFWGGLYLPHEGWHTKFWASLRYK